MVLCRLVVDRFIIITNSVGVRVSVCVISLFEKLCSEVNKDAVLHRAITWLRNEGRRLFLINEIYNS